MSIERWIRQGATQDSPQMSTPAVRLPLTIAIIDGDSEFLTGLKTFLHNHGTSATGFTDSDEFVTSHAPFEYGFYVLDLDCPGIDGFTLCRLIRKRLRAGILVLSSRAQVGDFEKSLNAGADMYLAKPVRLEQVIASIQAIQRRVVNEATLTHSTWVYDKHARQLTTPEGNVVELSPTDALLIERFVSAGTNLVTHEQIRETLGISSSEESDNTLHAAIYRLKRRIERSTDIPAPLQSQSRAGYVFKGEIALK